MKHTLWIILIIPFFLMPATSVLAAKDKIIHDAEYSIIEAQNGEKW